MTESSPPQTAIERSKLSALAVTGFVLGVLSLAVSWITFLNLSAAFLLGPLAVIFGVAGLLRTTVGHLRGRPLAIVGLILTVIAFVILIFVARVYSRVAHELAGSGFDTSIAAGTKDDPLPLNTAISTEKGFVVSIGEPYPIDSMGWGLGAPDDVVYAIPATIRNDFIDPQQFLGSMEEVILADGRPCTKIPLRDFDMAQGRFLEPGGESLKLEISYDCPAGAEISLIGVSFTVSYDAGIAWFSPAAIAPVTPDG